MGGDLLEDRGASQLCRKEVSVLVFKGYRRPRTEPRNHETKGTDFLPAHLAQGVKKRGASQKFRPMAWTGLLGFAQSIFFFFFIFTLIQTFIQLACPTRHLCLNSEPWSHRRLPLPRGPLLLPSSCGAWPVVSSHAPIYPSCLTLVDPRTAPRSFFCCSSFQDLHGSFGGEDGQNTQVRPSVGQNTPRSQQSTQASEEHK